jgi:hypothetical protein
VKNKDTAELLAKRLGALVAYRVMEGFPSPATMALVELILDEVDRKIESGGESCSDKRMSICDSCGHETDPDVFDKISTFTIPPIQGPGVYYPCPNCGKPVTYLYKDNPGESK